jgi:hypothetical protein
MDDGSLAREVRRIAVPAILSSLLQTMVYVVDRAMLGHYAESSLAAMQVAGPLEWSLWSVFSAFEVGTIARVGRHVGAKDRARARRAALLSMGVAAVAGSALVALWPAVAPWLGAAYPPTLRPRRCARRARISIGRWARRPSCSFPPRRSRCCRRRGIRGRRSSPVSWRTWRTSR